ncbi:MAG: hypothetical protein MUE60_16085, partial [Candidatus Eisenbacteria bacterium]|nr:hypothetical protein [Candidatus Eisenbacteria bacterium]
MSMESRLRRGAWLLVAGLPALVASGPHDRAQAQAAFAESSCIPGLDSLTSATLRRALDYLGVEEPELGFDKLYAEDDTFRLAAVERILGNPLELPAFQQGLWDRLRSHAGSVSSLPEVMRCLGEAMEAPEPLTSPGRIMRPGSTAARLVQPDSLSPFQDAADRFVRSCDAVQASLDAAFAGLTDEDREEILNAAPAFWGDPDDAEDAVRAGCLHREFGVTVSAVDDVGEDAVLDAAARLNRPALTAASRQFMESVVALWGDVQAVMTANPGATKTCSPIHGVDGSLLAVFDTPWGALVIAGAGQNIYTEEAMREIAFLVDLGGDDVYRGRASSAVGGLLRSLAVLVDGGGVDLYDAGGRDFCLGGAVLGVAALIDLAGDDVYRAGDGTMGAGFFGSGLLADWGGNDMFDGRNLCEG